MWICRMVAARPAATRQLSMRGATDVTGMLLIILLTMCAPVDARWTCLPPPSGAVVVIENPEANVRVLMDKETGHIWSADSPCRRTED